LGKKSGTMKPSQSIRLQIRSLDTHCLTWGDSSAPLMMMLHGYQDCGASWQFTVDALARDWFVVAPDWRGYGLSAWSGADCYWNQDYLGDLDQLTEHFSPEAPVTLVAHSLGGQVAALYAGVRPDRVSHLVNIEGFSGQLSRQEAAPKRLAKWLMQLRDNNPQRPYESFDHFAQRLQAENPRLTDERALFVAQHWGQIDAQGLVVRRADPAHKMVNPAPMSSTDTVDCWRQTSAKVLWVDGQESGLMSRFLHQTQEFEARSQAYTDLQIRHIAEAGHNIHHDQPEQLARVIEDFLANS
jgi:pimeloyl-ACP methyl ester carboxylesterase